MNTQQNNNNNSNKQFSSIINSYKSCLCLLFTIIALILVIVLVAISVPRLVQQNLSDKSNDNVFKKLEKRFQNNIGNEEKKVNNSRESENTVYDKSTQTISTTAVNYFTVAQKNRDDNPVLLNNTLKKYYTNSEKKVSLENNRSTINFETSPNTTSILPNDTKFEFLTDNTRKFTAFNDQLTTPTKPTTNSSEISTQKSIEGNNAYSTAILDETSSKSTSVKTSHAIIASIPVTKSYSILSTDNKPIIPMTCPLPPKLCETVTCKRSASKIIALMDHSLDACQDFYNYACMGVDVNRMKDPRYENVIQENIRGFEEKNGIFGKFNKFYHSCILFNSTEGLITLSQKLNEIFNNQQTHSDNETNALTDIIAKILMINPTRSSSHIFPMFDLNMDVDIDGKFIPILTIPSEITAQAKLSLAADGDTCLQHLNTMANTEKNLHLLYEIYINCKSNASNYIITLNQMFEQLKTFNSFQEFKNTTEVEKLLNFIKLHVLDSFGGITKRNQTDSQRGVIKPEYIELNELQKQYSQINWKRLLSTLLNGKVTKVTKIGIKFKSFLDKIFGFYKKHSLRDIISTLRIMVLHDLYSDIYSVAKVYPREDYCLKITIQSMGDIAAKILVSTANKKDLDFIDETTSNIFNELKHMFNESLMNSTWLTSEQKGILSGHLKKIQVVSDVNNLFFNDQILDYRYEKVEFINNFFVDILHLRENQRLLTYNKIENNPGNIWLFIYNPLGVTVTTILPQNKVVLPPGLITKIIFRRRRSPQWYELFAKLGFELSRGIVTFFRPDYLKRLIPSIEENEIFKNFLHIRLADPEITKTENLYELVISKEDLLLTRNERFVDDAALRLAFNTYEGMAYSKDLPLLWLNFTIPQLFYIFMTQEFCQPKESLPEVVVKLMENTILPNYFRINSMIMNSVTFSEQFKCALGSSMNAAFKTDAFPFIVQSDIDYI